jgi:hypothetical protein
MWVLLIAFTGVTAYVVVPLAAGWWMTQTRDVEARLALLLSMPLALAPDTCEGGADRLMDAVYGRHAQVKGGA